MNSIVCTRPGAFEYQTRKDPVPQPDHTILRVKRIGVCGTDLHAFEGVQPYFTYPRVLGHELACEIVDGQLPHGFEIGEPVTIIPYFNCGVCVACRGGFTNCCVKMQVCGVHVDGGMVEYLSVPSSALMHGAGLTTDELTLVEPFAIGAHAICRAGVLPGETVLVVGAGPIGLTLVAFAQDAGAEVIVMDINEQRLQFCRERLGVKHCINGGSPDVIEELRQITKGDMPTVVFDATGSQKAINNAFQYMAHSARYVMVGIQKGDISFSHPEFHKREGTLMSSRNATRKDFEFVIESIRAKRVHPSTLITQRMEFAQVKSEFRNLLDPSRGVIKAVIDFS